MEHEYIKYGFAALDVCGEKLFRVTLATDEIRERFDKLNSELDPTLEGKAKEAYTAKADEIRMRLKKMYSDLERSKRKLDRAVEEHRRNEENLQNVVVRELSDENIF